MALGGTYEEGTASVTNGSKIVSTLDTFWNDVIEGDWFIQAGLVSMIDSVNVGKDQITLKDNWQGSTASNASYRIVRMSWLRYDPSITQAEIRKLIVGIEEAGIFLFVSGAAPSPSLGEDGQYALKTNQVPWKLWYRDNGVWTFIGSPVGVAWRGAWSMATAFTTNDAVARLGRSYIAIQASTNKPPESNPDYWDIIALGGDRYDLAVWASARPDSGENMVQVVLPTTVTYEVGLFDSAARADTAATASAVFSIRKNGVEFATITFGVGSTVGVFACTAQTVVTAGQKISIIAPASRDATLADISITLTGYRG